MNTAQDVSIFCELQIKWRINVFTFLNSLHYNFLGPQ